MQQRHDAQVCPTSPLSSSRTVTGRRSRIDGDVARDGTFLVLMREISGQAAACGQETASAHAWLSDLKELRPGSAGRSEIRILYIFDPRRNAVLLVAGDHPRSRHHPLRRR